MYPLSKNALAQTSHECSTLYLSADTIVQSPRRATVYMYIFLCVSTPLRETLKKCRSTWGIVRIWCLVVAQLVCSFAYSQRKDIGFDHLDINSGLSQNHIMCIMQDSRGFMWFGTRDGLNKYDGYKFTIYKNDPNDSTSISNNYVTGIVEDSKGEMWVTTRGGGINRYDKKKDRFTQFKSDPGNSNSLSSDLATDLTIDANDNVWICTEDGGLDYYEPSKKRFTRFVHDREKATSISDNNTRCVFEDNKKRLWIGSFGGGLNLFDRNTKTFTRYRNRVSDPTSLSNDNVSTIFQDSRNLLWIGTVGGGLNQFDPDKQLFKRFRHDTKNVNSICSDVILEINEDNAGNIWIGTENGGLSIYNPATGQFYNYQHDRVDNKSLSHNSVYSIYRDTYGSMWVGTFAGGINVFNKDANRFAHFKNTSDPNSLSHNNVLNMTESANGSIWIGTDGGGVSLYDPVKKSFKRFKHEPGNKQSICGNYVLGVLEDSNGNLWVGTWADGLTLFNPKLNTYTHFKNDPAKPSTISSNNAWVLVEDQDKNIWIGAYNGGLNLYNPKTKDFTRFDDGTSNISSKKIHSITAGRNGKLWISTDGAGLQVFDTKTRTFTRYMHQDGSNSLSDNRINNVYEDKTGNLWINTMAGLNHLDIRKNFFTLYNTSNGLPNNIILGLLEDKNGDLWITTNRGLSRMNPRTRQFKNYGVQDGLQSYEFKMRAFCKSRAGAMYIGGINGFNEFYPDSIRENAFNFPLVLTDFQIFNKKVPIAKNDADESILKQDISETREITLPYNKSVISIEFASLNFSASENKQYAYTLQGFDKSWHNVGTNRTATYTNLDPGKYTFKIKALNNEGGWSSNVRNLIIIIEPPFWLTWWFRISVVLVLAGLAYAIVRSRINRITRQKKILELTVKTQTAQLVQLNEVEHTARLEAEEARAEADFANLELERKNNEMEQFVYIASHDLREPLRTTANFVELFQRQYHSKIDAKGEAYLSYIIQSTERMKRLIDDLLNYSRTGINLEVQAVDCNDVLKEVLADLGVALSEAGAEITAENLPEIMGHRTSIKQLFQNLITNGIKFRKSGTIPRITIQTKTFGNNAQFSFTDNGIGIDKNNLEKIFVIFQRLHTRKEYEGSGIGLAHCKKIVDHHKGRIWAESTPGTGSSFCFTIPNVKES
ncbi:MAG: hypothetical protein H7Y42_14560 [Chitinophagaceae bacterium]|nr:hypothetical protein [Chitinophagaceae bacterium]